MTTVNDIHAVADWLEREVCPKIELKVPSNKHQTDDYEYKLAHPSVSRMFSTTFSKGSTLNTAPNILVQLLNGSDHPLDFVRSLNFRLILLAWYPGAHALDYLKEEDQKRAFVANDEGWNDLFNFMDVVLRDLKNAEYIGDSLRVKFEDGFDYGPCKEGESVIEFYPFFVGEIKFSCESSQAPPIKPYIDDLL